MFGPLGFLGRLMPGPQLPSVGLLGGGQMNAGEMRGLLDVAGGMEGLLGEGATPGDIEAMKQLAAAFA